MAPSTAGRLILLAAPLCALAQVAPTPSAALAHAAEPQATGMFGFAVGEHRRYENWPRELTRVGNFREWGITLQHVEGEPGERRATFVLDFRKGDRPRRSPNHIELGSERDVRITVMDATLVVNEHGFPLEAHSRAGSRSTVRRTRVTWVEGSFLVRNPDTTGLREYYLRLSELEGAAEADVGGVYASGWDVWANPGLASIAVHELLSRSADGTRRLDYMRLDPAGAVRGVLDRPLVRAAERRARHLRPRSMTLRGRERIEIGGRTFDSWHLDQLSGSDLWVDERARVLRAGDGPRYTRLMLPHEY